MVQKEKEDQYSVCIQYANLLLPNKPLERLQPVV